MIASVTMMMGMMKMTIEGSHHHHHVFFFFFPLHRHFSVFPPLEHYTINSSF